MNRKELDELIAHFQLPPPQVERVLTLAGARPTPQETSRFAIRTLLLAGVLSLAAGIVFFVAANWSELRVVGRFVLLELLLLGTLVLAFSRTPPQPLGRYALLAAFIITGALLALFGQTYQTGANLYELFLTWAALGLPIIIAGQWSVLWAAWALVLNLALALFCGFRPEGGLLWIAFGNAWTTTGLLLIAALANISLWALTEFLRTRVPVVGHLVPSALRRFLLACAIAFATWAGVSAIHALEARYFQIDVASLLCVLAMLAAVAMYTLRRQVDVFPLALVAASLILIVLVGIGRDFDGGRSDTLLRTMFMAIWLIGSSGVAARVILILRRSWHAMGEAA